MRSFSTGSPRLDALIVPTTPTMVIRGLSGPPRWISRPSGLCPSEVAVGQVLVDDRPPAGVGRVASVKRRPS
jgi:hypothetical protein